MCIAVQIKRNGKISLSVQNDILSVLILILIW